jgi:hypothetical protein
MQTIDITVINNYNQLIKNNSYGKKQTIKQSAGRIPGYAGRRSPGPLTIGLPRRNSIYFIILGD